MNRSNIDDLNDNSDKYNVNNNLQNILSQPIDKSLVFDVNFLNKDDLSSTSSIQDNFNKYINTQNNPTDRDQITMIKNEITHQYPVSILRF